MKLGIWESIIVSRGNTFNIHPVNIRHSFLHETNERYLRDVMKNRISSTGDYLMAHLQDKRTLDEEEYYFVNELEYFDTEDPELRSVMDPHNFCEVISQDEYVLKLKEANSHTMDMDNVPIIHRGIDYAVSAYDKNKMLYSGLEDIYI